MLPLGDELFGELFKYYQKDIFKNEKLLILKRSFKNHFLHPVVIIMENNLLCFILIHQNTNIFQKENEEHHVGCTILQDLEGLSGLKA